MSSEKIRLKIERMSPEGQGLGRPSQGGGRVHFVPYTAPGDEIEARVLQTRSGFARARLERLLHAGPARVSPRCPHHFKAESPGPACGGCAWQHLSMEAQGEAKREIVRDCLFRIAKLREPKVLPTIAAPEPWRYRNKVQVPFGTDSSGRILAGFYAPGSHRIIDFDDCLVQPELSVRIALRVKALAKELKMPIYHEDRQSGWLRHLLIRTNQDGKALVSLVSKTPQFHRRETFVSVMRGEFPEIIGIHQNIQPLKTAVVLGPKWKKLWGRDYLLERLGDIRLRVSPSAFLQVNTPSCERLYELVSRCLGERPGLVLDLYSGVGSIALWVARSAKQVIGVEENQAAVRDAKENARLNAIANAKFYAGSVEALIRRVSDALESTAPGQAAAVLDPPRAGCSKTVLKALRHPGLGRIVYVSCNPATFARDADWLSRHGWKLTRVQPVDLFPQTFHVETVGLFERRK